MFLTKLNELVRPNEILENVCEGLIYVEISLLITSAIRSTG